jgi:hypothetical protein
MVQVSPPLLGDLSMSLSRVNPIRAVFIAAALTVGLAGCINGVGWLPDSSGFVFSTATGKLVHYDLKKRAMRVLVDDTKSNTYWPAVSPDGQRVAIARLDIDANKQAKLQVVAYDFAGKVVHESPRLPWGTIDKGPPEDMNTVTQLFWAPDGNKLLVYGSIDATDGTTGLYDLATQKAETWEHTIPTAFGGTPVRPDGKGFFVAKLTLDTQKLAGFDFVDWNGKSTRINADATADDKDRVLEHLWPVLRTSEWRGPIATVATLAGRTLLDTQKATLTREPVNPDDFKLQRQDIWSEVKFASGVRICVLADAKKGTVENFEVVAYDPKRKKSFILVEEASDRLVTLLPSPDRKFAVVRVYEGDRRGPDADMLYVVNEFGRVVQTVDVFDRFREKE